MRAMSLSADQHTGISSGPTDHKPSSSNSMPQPMKQKVTCGLTACTPGSALGPTLVKEYGGTLPFTFLPVWCSW